VILFLLFDREITNFTYDISNIQELISFLSKEFGVQESIIDAFVKELENDLELRTSLETRLSERKDRNKHARYGRRIGWYCITRMIRPSVIVETGTADGLGTAILARALHKNSQEGSPGTLLSFDIQSDTGWLIDPTLGDSFRLIIGDAKSSMDANLSGTKVDFFIHDSDHSYGHETWELETISKYLTEKAVIVSDNAHASDAMKTFCESRSLPFAFFREQPKQHFYPGGGIGLSRWERRQR
jgi:predicted O-methyltransferase YrrM